MARDPVIPRERLSDYERWEIGPLAGGRASGAAARPVQLPTAQQLEQIHQQARDEGYAAGLREGSAQAQAAAARAAAMLDALAGELARVEQEVAASLLALALEVAEQMTRQAIKLQPERVLGVIREAIDALPQVEQGLRLHLNPEDAQIVRGSLGEHAAHGGWRVFEDPRIERGGCRLESGGSQIDATVAARWKRIVARLAEEPGWLC